MRFSKYFNNLKYIDKLQFKKNIFKINVFI